MDDATVTILSDNSGEDNNHDDYSSDDNASNIDDVGQSIRNQRKRTFSNSSTVASSSGPSKRLALRPDHASTPEPGSGQRAKWDPKQRYKLLQLAHVAFRAGRLAVTRMGASGGGALADVYSQWAAELSTPGQPLTLMQVKNRWGIEKKLWRQVKWLDDRSGTTISREEGRVFTSDYNWKALKVEFGREAMTWMQRKPFCLPDSDAIDMYEELFHNEKATGQDSLEATDLVRLYERQEAQDSQRAWESQNRNTEDGTEIEEVSSISLSAKERKERLKEARRAKKAQARQEALGRADPTKNTDLDDSDGSAQAPNSFRRRNRPVTNLEDLGESTRVLARNLANAARTISAHEEANYVKEAMDDFMMRFKERLSPRQRYNLLPRLQVAKEAQLYNSMDDAVKEIWIEEVLNEASRTAGGSRTGE
jgi:hypothetical protein